MNLSVLYLFCVKYALTRCSSYTFCLYAELIAEKDRGKPPLPNRLSCRFKHVFDENSVTSRRIIHQHMSHCANKFAILNDGTSAHE